MSAQRRVEPLPPAPSGQQRVDAVLDTLQDPPVLPAPRTLREGGLPTRRLTMEEALRRALTNHPDLRIALADIEAQEFGVTLATAPRYPKIDLSASADQSGNSGSSMTTRLSDGQQIREEVRGSIQRSYGLGIGLSQQLLDFGRTKYRVQIAELDLTATRLQYLETRQNVINDVVQAYFNLLRQSQAIEVGLENVRNAELLVEQARGFLEAGTRAKIELIRAEAGLANARFLVVQAQGGYGRALAALATALGEDQLPQEMPEPFTLELPDWDVETVRGLARRQRPDLVIAGVRVAQAEARIRAARAEYYPIVSASAGYSWNDSVFPPVNSGYNVGINLNVPIFNEPELSSGVGQAEANLKSAAAALESSELVVVEEATAALYTLREAVGSSEAAGQGLRAAEENFRLADERYRVGVGNSLEVSEAQRLLVEARSVELQARYSVQTAIGDLLRATGELDGQAVLAEDLRLDPIFEIPEEVIHDDQPRDIPEIPRPQLSPPPAGAETSTSVPAPSQLPKGPESGVPAPSEPPPSPVQPARPSLDN